ncbi:MAG: endonuclease/exonuclease/phosphatase family protein [Granulosicoccus sp.]
MTYAMAFIAALLLVATLLPLSVRREWWIRSMDFPRVQIVALCIGWLFVSILFIQTLSPLMLTSGVVVTTVLLYQCHWIYPHTPLHDVEVQALQWERKPATPVIKILSSNVLMTNRQAEPLKKLVLEHKPDILVTLESDQWWQDELDTLNQFPHRIACPLDNLYGMHVYSRFELLNSQIHYRVEDDKPSMSMQVRINKHNDVAMHVMHPAPPAPGENAESTERDVELIMLARELQGHTQPTIVAGDLNDVAWSATTRLLRQISGLHDPRIGRGVFNTFHAHFRFIRWPLDHVFVSSHFRLIDLQTLPDIGSDHFPLLAELALANDSPSENSVAGEPLDKERLDHITGSETAKQAQ